MSSLRTVAEASFPPVYVVDNRGDYYLINGPGIWSRRVEMPGEDPKDLIREHLTHSHFLVMVVA